MFSYARCVSDVWFAENKQWCVWLSLRVVECFLNNGFRFYIVYLIFVIHGIGVLMPWNMFITANDVSDPLLPSWFSLQASSSLSSSSSSFIVITAIIIFETLIICNHQSLMH